LPRLSKWHLIALRVILVRDRPPTFKEIAAVVDVVTLEVMFEAGNSRGGGGRGNASHPQLTDSVVEGGRGRRRAGNSVTTAN
jgi:hypothetical protein